MYDFLIVGAGIFGAVFANEASKAGKKCLVIDRQKNVGGILYSQNPLGVELQRPRIHIFRTEEKRIWDYINLFGDFIRNKEEKTVKYSGFPVYGYARIISKMLSGSDVFLNTSCQQVLHHKPDIAKKIIYTGRLDEFYQYCYGEMQYKFHNSVNYVISEDKVLNELNGEMSDFIQTEENIELFGKYAELAGKEANVLFGGRFSHPCSYTIGQSVKDALRLSEEELY